MTQLMKGEALGKLLDSRARVYSSENNGNPVAEEGAKLAMALGAKRILLLSGLCS